MTFFSFKICCELHLPTAGLMSQLLQLKQNSKTGQKFGPLTSIYHSCFVWQLYKNTLKPYFGSYTKPCSLLQTQYLDSKSTAALEVVISQYLMWQWKIWIMHKSIALSKKPAIKVLHVLYIKMLFLSTFIYWK